MRSRQEASDKLLTQVKFFRQDRRKPVLPHLRILLRQCFAAAAAAMCGEDGGINMDVSGIEAAYSEKNIMRILYSEVPCVLIQIRDDDYDYVDSQMLLQDLAYYPLGHPGRTLSGPGLVSGRRPAVSDILASLIQSQASEGED